MRLPRFRVRTLMIAVSVVALFVRGAYGTTPPRVALCGIVRRRIVTRCGHSTYVGMLSLF
jgi:hypothetical protein